VLSGLTASVALAALVALAGAKPTASTPEGDEGIGRPEMKARWRPRTAAGVADPGGGCLRKTRAAKCGAGCERPLRAAQDRIPVCAVRRAGPKTRRRPQAPRGSITSPRAQMNPNSAYYLSFNMGYPNAYDKAWGRAARS